LRFHRHLEPPEWIGIRIPIIHFAGARARPGSCAEALETAVGFLQK
jgi:hypothetical protein